MTFEAEGIVLRTQLVRDADLFVSILTAEHGTLTAYALSAKRSKIRYPGGLDIFDLGRFELERSPRGSMRLNAVQAPAKLLGLRANLATFALAATLIETSIHFAPEGDPTAGQLYQPLLSALTELNRADSTECALNSTVAYLESALRISGFSDSTAITGPTTPAQFMNILDLIERTVGQQLKSRSALGALRLQTATPRASNA